MKLQDIDKDDLLKTVGLQTYRSPFWAAVPGAALFGVGLLVGTGLGMIFAPKSGQEIRSDIADRFTDMKNYATQKARAAGIAGDVESAEQADA